jgi:TonB family protein
MRVATPVVLAVALAVLLAAIGLEARQAENSPPPQFLDATQVEPSIAQGLLDKQVQPVYPEQARQMRVQGTVVLHVLINKKGKVTQVTIVSGHPLLVPAAINAVKQWKYKPYRVEGRSVNAQTDVIVNFEF